MKSFVRKLNRANPIFALIKFGRILKQIITLANELFSDHATQKTAMGETKTLIEEMHDNHADFITWIQDIEDALSDLHGYERNRDGISDGGPGLRAATNDSKKVQVNAFHFRISGQEYYKKATDDAITLAGTITAAGNKWGAWRFEVDKLGVLSATNFGATMAEGSKEDALLSLAAVALGSNKVITGYLVIQATGTDWVGDSHTPLIGDSFVNAIEWFDCNGPTGLTAQDGTLEVGSTPEQISIGATTPHILGLDLAPISADTGQTFTVADTITASKFAGWLILVDLTGAGFITLSVDGDPIVTDQAYNDAGDRDTAMANVIARLPGMFVLIGTLKVENNGSGWAANANNLTNGGDVITAVLAVKTAGAYSASNPDHLVKPADATASAVPGLGTGKPASGPASLSAVAVDDISGDIDD